MGTIRKGGKMAPVEMVPCGDAPCRYDPCGDAPSPMCQSCSLHELEQFLQILKRQLITGLLQNSTTEWSYGPLKVCRCLITRVAGDD